MRSHVSAARYSLQMPSKTKIPDTRYCRKGWSAKLQLTCQASFLYFPLYPRTPETTPIPPNPQTLDQYGLQEFPLHDIGRGMHPGVNTRVSPRNTYCSYAKVPRGRGRPEATTPSLARTTGPTQNAIPAHPVPRVQGRVNPLRKWASNTQPQHREDTEVHGS